MIMPPIIPTLTVLALSKKNRDGEESKSKIKKMNDNHHFSKECERIKRRLNEGRKRQLGYIHGEQRRIYERQLDSTENLRREHPGEAICCILYSDDTPGFMPVGGFDEGIYYNLKKQLEE